MLQTYRELKVWQTSMEFTKRIYSITNNLPKDELYGITSQMRRAAVSVPSNIAEGQARYSTKEFIKFLSIAKGSICELETQLLLCIAFDYLNETDISDSMELICQVRKMITSMIKKLSLSQ